MALTSITINYSALLGSVRQEYQSFQQRPNEELHVHQVRTPVKKIDFLLSWDANVVPYQGGFLNQLSSMEATRLYRPKP